MALQEAAEAYLVSLFEDTNLAAIHAKRESPSRHRVVWQCADKHCRRHDSAEGPRACSPPPWRALVSALLSLQLFSLVVLCKPRVS
jgi:hypothetical protein